MWRQIIRVRDNHPGEFGHSRPRLSCLVRRELPMACKIHEIIDDRIQPPTVALILRGWRPGKPAPAQAGPGVAHRRLAGLLLTWMARARERRALAELDVRLLDDIGVTREAAERENARPFWRPGRGPRQAQPRPRSATILLLHRQGSPR